MVADGGKCQPDAVGDNNACRARQVSAAVVLCLDLAGCEREPERVEDNLATVSVSCENQVVPMIGCSVNQWFCGLVGDENLQVSIGGMTQEFVQIGRPEAIAVDMSDSCDEDDAPFHIKKAVLVFEKFPTAPTHYLWDGIPGRPVVVISHNGNPLCPLTH